MSNRISRQPSKGSVIPVSFAALFALALLAGPAAANGTSPDACAESLAQRVQEHYEQVRDLSGRFEQRSRSVAFGGPLGEEEVARGEVWFAKPGRMRWSYETPEPSLVVSDGSTLWIYDPEAREVQTLAVDEAFLSGAAIQFLLGEGRILEAYRVEARDCEEPEPTLRLWPLAPSTYEWLDLRVEAESGAVRATVVADLLGNRTEVSFRGVQTNQGPAEDLFRFDPPEGVRVLTIPGP